MSTQILLKKWARQREMQEQKIEKSRAAKEFFDKNRNLTSHFESWTTPQFYQQSSRQIERTKETRRREEELGERRQRLRELREREEQEWQREQQEGRRRRVPTKCLSAINNHLAETAKEEKRKSELESQLYSRWRFDATRDKIIHESRSTHEALAKLSWLDRQVEQNMERERRDTEAAEREQRMQEETERQEKLLRENRQVLDSQMRELHSMQESHMDGMRRHDIETRTLKEEELHLRERLRKIEELFRKWQDHVESHTAASPRPMHNLRRIKMHIDMRISTIRERIDSDMDFLRNLLKVTADDTVQPLLGKFQRHVEDTDADCNRVRSLYDSEAKSFLVEREVVWTSMKETRERLIRHTVNEMLNRTSLEIEKIASRHQELSDIKATHLRAIDHTNDLLRELKREHSSPQQLDIPIAPPSVADDIPPIRRENDDCDSIVNQLSSQRITPRDEEQHSVGGVPRFGRKKIAWT